MEIFDNVCASHLMLTSLSMTCAAACLHPLSEQSSVAALAPKFAVPAAQTHRLRAAAGLRLLFVSLLSAKASSQTCAHSMTVATASSM